MWKYYITMKQQCAFFLLLLFAMASASVQSISDMDRHITARMQEVQGATAAAVSQRRHQRFNHALNTAPLETLFQMQKGRRDDLQTYFTEMMQHARLHQEAKRKVQEDMQAMRERQ